MFRHGDRPLIAPLPSRASLFGLAGAPLRLGTTGGPTVADARVLDVLETVERELGRPQSVKRIAAQLRLSPSRFEHLFKKQIGQTFKDFVRAARMTRAKKMLQDPTLRIKEVAAAVGYANASDFTRDFRKQYGRSPSRSRSPSS